MLKCAGCKKEKPEADFRYMPKKGRHYHLCRSCEAEFIKERNIRHSKRQYMLKTFRELCKHMDSADIDCLLFELKQIKDEVKGSEGKRFS